MELRQYLEIFRKRFNLLAGTVALFVLASFAYFSLRPVEYVAVLSLNISRSGEKVTEQYAYDEFYRLQADEKFAETIVQWLQDPRIVSDIYMDAGLPAESLSLSRLSKSLDAEKRSSQFVTIRFSANNEESAKNIARSVAESVARKTEELNEFQKEKAWFAVIAEDPIIRRNDFAPGTILTVSATLGLLCGLWLSLISHYFKKTDEDRN